MNKYVVTAFLRHELDDKVLDYIKTLGKPKQINYTSSRSDYAAELYYDHEEENQIEALQQKINTLEEQLYKQGEEHTN